MKKAIIFQNRRNKRNRGFVALTAVLILSALFLSVVINLTSQSVGFAKRDTATQAGAISALLAHACAQHALMQTVTQLHYIGNETLTFDEGQCEVELLDEAADGTRTIQTTGVTKEHAYRVVVEVSNISPSVTVSAYQTVVTF